jgi:ribosome maturation factor RimP
VPNDHRAVTTATQHNIEQKGFEMSESPVADRAVKLVGSILSDLRLETWDAEVAGGVLRFTLDKPAGEGHVTLDELSLATRLINRELDHAEPPFPNVAIEVTSPGLERALRTPAHYVRSIGVEVAIRLTALADGDRRLHGVIVAADTRTVTVASNDGDSGGDNAAAGAQRTVRYADIERAKTVFHWGPTPKPGKTPAPKRGKAASSAVKRSDAATTDNNRVAEPSIDEGSDTPNEKELAS